MAAYVIVDIEVTDPVQYETYKRTAASTVTAHGGRYIVRGGQAERLEGTWAPRRVVVLEFPSMEQARTWWSSDDYRPARDLRREAATFQMILVEGV
ncbi:MAG: DUF1330 domain-containing protein [Gemmatimonadota bacterium]|nr:DUF1330 domain-containing protein [Gemmatimonadota bacterium]MDH3367824.1 DUF1330 domain-containing protein [Gemmatimonadota bacterium]MDH3477508.1 DUF1330 domain-containing protein [Gemmatimonadota bacterium]MDH3569009.1 DUF1330 domain-containing protein [Gemmatimonadota bacterium]MDH5549151.1 DUF1330 domain-containing protein [Gemmatimonadota bacterium]